MASALEQLTQNYETSSPVEYKDYYDAYLKDNGKGFGYLAGSQGADPNSFGEKIRAWFTGEGKSAQSAYNNYLAEYDWHRKQKATAEANSQTYAREDSQIQRLMEDYSKSGLNPYLLLSGGNLSSGVVSSQAQRSEWKRKSEEKSRENEGKALNSALKVLALFVIRGLL